MHRVVLAPQTLRTRSGARVTTTSMEQAGQAGMKEQSCQKITPNFLFGELCSRDIKKDKMQEEEQGENNHNWRNQGRHKKYESERGKTALEMLTVMTHDI